MKKRLIILIVAAVAFLGGSAENLQSRTGTTGILPVGRGSTGTTDILSDGNGDSFIAHSMLTRDGRRMVSRLEGGKRVYSLMPTNQLPANLPPVREWKLYGIKAAHTDIGLTNPQYIQRHWTVRRIDEAARLIDADKRTDSDPAAYRYVMEGVWFWDNYHQDKGMDAAWRIVTNYMARGRMDVGVTCAGNHTHLYSATEIDRSTLTKRLLEQKWGIHTHTFFMADNPGLSCSLIDPYVRAGIRNCIFLPNQWNPIRSTIWKMRKKMLTSNPDYNNPDLQGGGSRIAVSYDLDLPMVFRWKAPGGKESLLVWCSTHYGRGYERLGLDSKVNPSHVPVAEARMPEFLEILESKYPYDVWLAGVYCDDEWPGTGFADFAAKWNEKWLWPQFRTVGRLDEPFDLLEKKFGDKILTLTGEMTSGWLQHAASTPELLADKLNADRLLETAERLGTFAETIDRGAVDRAWWHLILNDEHSYGTSGYKGRRVFETWMQHRDWIERAAATASNELAKAVAKLGLKAPENPEIPENPDHALRLCRDGVTENRWYRVAVTNGVIYSIYDKELSRELIDGPANSFMYTRNNHKTWEAEPEKALGAKVTRRVYLAENEKRIDIEDRFEHARDLFNARRYYRFGYLAFPFAVPGGAFRAHLNGTVIRPYEDCHPMTTDAYCAVRDWCLVENADFGVALMMRDSTLTEFGEIHPDKTCYTGKPPKGKTAIYPYLFTDWLQMHQPDGDSMNFTFRFAITSYAKGGRWAHVARMCEDWLDPYAKWMREHNVPRVTRESVEEPPPGWTGLIEKPRAGHGEKDGQMYILWGAEMSPDFDHYEIWRDGKFLANVTNEAPNGIPYRVARYEDNGLPTHSRHEYRIRKVWKDGRKDPLGEPFWGLTRQGAAIASPSPVVTYRAAPEGFPGAVMVTADADGAPYFDCVGEAAPGRRMEPDTVFWMASNTKGVLAALVLNLVSEGKLSLDDPVEKYFPSWKKLPVKNRPTLRMLLCHTSGLDVFPKKALARPGMEALAEHVHVEPLKFEPDTKYLYSNWDIDVAAAIVEKVTGSPFEVEMAERIFKPLGMTDSTFIPNASQNARRVAFYKLSDKKPPMPTKIVRGKLAPPYMEVGVHPEAGGGLLSTPRDMIKFFQMIARGGLTPDGRRLISAPLMEKWTAKQTPKCVKVGYSFGMKVDGKGSLSHGGAAGTWAEANVKTRKARLYMVNVQGSSKVAKSFRDDWMKKTELVPARAVVTEAGADPTGKTDSTAAIQKCIDRVSASGGGTVVVPPGVYRILYLSLRPHVRLELAGGAERATDGWTPEVAARAMDPARSAIIRSAANRKGHWSIFLYNLVPRTDATNGFSDVTVSGGVFDCQGRHLPAAFACGRNIRFENAVVKDISNNHALQIDGCENVVVTNCLFAGYVFKGAYTRLTRETIQVEQTSPGALGNPETSPISCAKEISIPNRNVSVTGCWFGPSERLGPHLVALGHHGRARSCNGLVFAGNVVVNPLYCGVRLANVSDARVEDNTFISTNSSRRLASDSAVVCVWGDAGLKPGEKGVVLRGNKVVLSARSPLRKMWVSTPRHKEVSSADGVSERFASAWECRRGEPYRESPVAPPVFNGHPRFARTYSHSIITFALRVFHNAEADKYALANTKIVENCRFYIENTDVRDDRDSFYWNIGELCRAVLHYGANGDIAPGRLSPEAESAFREMAFGYCHDISKLDDADSDGVKTWRVYESENHHVQRASALWQLMHVLLKADPAYGERKLADGGTLRAHYEAWEDFFCTWMRERAKRSMFIEVQSRGYGIHTIKNIYPLYDFSGRPATRRLAKNFLDLFWALWAEEQIDGASGGGMSRVYTTGARGTFSEAAVWAYWYFGLNAFMDRVPNGMDYVCLDSAYRPHPIIGKIASDVAARGVYEIEMRPLGWTLPTNKYPDYRPDPEWGHIYRYTYATPDFIVGTQMFPQAPCDKWCMISSQNRFHGVVYGPYDAQLLPIPEATGKHTKTATIPSVAFNSFWSMQSCGTLLTRKNKYASRTGGMRVWFSAAGGVDKVVKDGDWWFTKCGGAYSAVRVAKGGARLAVAGPKSEIPCERAGKFLVCNDQWTPVIVETARACDFKDEAAFRAKVKATVFALTPSALDYTGIYGQRFHMLLNADDGSTINGEPYVKKIDWSVKSPFVKIPWLGDAAELTFGGETVRLDFGLTM